MPTKSLSVSLSPLYREGEGEGEEALEPKLLQCRFAGSRAVLMHPSSLLFFFPLGWGGGGGTGLPVQKPSKFSCKLERFSLLMTPTVFL